MSTYDAIIVGARCAGAPTAMLLARAGHRVLLLDRMTFPSDIMSSHYIHLPGKLLLHRWGLLDRVLASGCPLIPHTVMHFNGVAFKPPPFPMPFGLTTEAIAPRRYILDHILIQAAVEAGAEFREGVSVRELLWEDGRVTGVGARTKAGTAIEERATVTVGADGLHSAVAKQVQPEEYESVPSLTFAYYTYWSGLPDSDAHIYGFADRCGVLSFPTHNGLTCLAAGGERTGFHEFRSDIEGNYMKMLDRVPGLTEMVRAGKREERFIGTADQPNYYRKPYGPGWALVGDAGYHRDFITGLGITDAFRDANLLSAAVSEGLSGARPMEEALADYQQHRDRISRPLYDVTLKMARLESADPSILMAFGAGLAAAIADAAS